MGKYNFDEIVERRHTNSLKYDECQNPYLPEHFIPMWVADMDFACPQPILDAMKARIDKRILAYACYNLPKEDTDFEGAAYRRTCLRFFRLMCATSLGKICASDHAMNAVEEMSALNRDLKRFFDENGASYPVWQSLEKDAEKYLR